MAEQKLEFISQPLIQRHFHWKEKVSNVNQQKLLIMIEVAKIL